MFDSDYYLQHCCKNGNAISIIGISIPILDKKLKIAMIAGSIYTNLVKRERNEVAIFITIVY